MAQLQQQLEEKTKEAQENFDRALRLAAEMENLKKRLEREKADLLQFANENLIKELLPVVDNLELALEHGRQAETPAPFLEGIELVHQGFLKALARFGVTPLVAVGQPFDPAYHNAVMQEAAPEVPDCTVLKELQKGYLMHQPPAAAGHGGGGSQYPRYRNFVSNSFDCSGGKLNVQDP